MFSIHNTLVSLQLHSLQSLRHHEAQDSRRSKINFAFSFGNLLSFSPSYFFYCFFFFFFFFTLKSTLNQRTHVNNMLRNFLFLQPTAQCPTEECARYGLCFSSPRISPALYLLSDLPIGDYLWREPTASLHPLHLQQDAFTLSVFHISVIRSSP